MLNRRPVYVLAFRVPQSSGYVLTEAERRIQVPFQEFVYADYETKAVVRVEMKCTDIPRGSEYIDAGLLHFQNAQGFCYERSRVHGLSAVQRRYHNSVRG